MKTNNPKRCEGCGLVTEYTTINNGKNLCNVCHTDNHTPFWCPRCEVFTKHINGTKCEKCGLETPCDD